MTPEPLINVPIIQLAAWAWFGCMGWLLLELVARHFKGPRS